jgi:hypothetical protein
VSGAAGLPITGRDEIGMCDALDGAIAHFSGTYADINARDYTAYLAAIEAGRASTPAVS